MVPAPPRRPTFVRLQGGTHNEAFGTYDRRRMNGCVYMFVNGYSQFEVRTGTETVH